MTSATAQALVWPVLAFIFVM